MDAVYGWIRNLTGFFLFWSVLENLLPGKKYGRYMRLFGGMVLILLVIAPLTGGLRIEERIAQYYELLVLRYDAGDLREEILGVEDRRLEQLIASYEDAVEEDVRQMAEDAGYRTRDCRVRIARDPEDERFGEVTAIALDLGRGPAAVPGGALAQTEKEAGEPADVRPVTPVETVAAVAVGAASRDGGKEAGAGTDGQSGAASLEAGAAALQKKIASYYHLEESYVEIQVLEPEG